MKKQLLACLVLTLIITSCATSFQKQKSRAELFYKQYPNELAAVCAYAFPVVPTFIKGKDSVRVDSTVITKYIRVASNKKDSVDCPVAQTITKIKTVTRVDTITKENTAAVAQYRAQNIVLGQNNEQLTKNLEVLMAQDKKRLYWIIGLSIALGLMVFFKIYGWVSSGFGLANLLKK